MTTNSKIIYISATVILILFLCSCTCCSILGLLGISNKKSNLLNTQEEINEDILIDLCNSHGNFTKNDYDKWFSTEFKQENTYYLTKQDIRKSFPEGFYCTYFEDKGFSDMISSDYSISSKTSNSVTIVTIIFRNEDSLQTKIHFEEGGGRWKITSWEIF